MEANYMKKQEFQYKDNSKNISCTLTLTIIEEWINGDISSSCKMSDESRVRTIPTAVVGINITNMAFIQTQNMRTGTNANVKKILWKLHFCCDCLRYVLSYLSYNH